MDFKAWDESNKEQNQIDKFNRNIQRIVKEELIIKDGLELNGARVRVHPVEWHEWWGVLFFDGEEWRIQSDRHPENCTVVQVKITGRLRKRLPQSETYGYRAQITFPEGKTAAWVVDEAFSK